MRVYIRTCECAFTNFIFSICKKFFCGEGGEYEPKFFPSNRRDIHLSPLMLTQPGFSAIFIKSPNYFVYLCVCAVAHVRLCVSVRVCVCLWVSVCVWVDFSVDSFLDERRVGV